MGLSLKPGEFNTQFHVVRVRIELDETPRGCPQRIRELAGVKKHPRQLELAKQNYRKEGWISTVRTLQRPLQGVLKNFWLNTGLHMPGVKGHKASKKKNHQKVWKTMSGAHTGWGVCDATRQSSHANRNRGNPRKSHPLVVVVSQNTSCCGLTLQSLEASLERTKVGPSNLTLIQNKGQEYSQGHQKKNPKPKTIKFVMSDI